jgi:4-methyl-5(b-hydroxyethyl)-thiazole monophosphate biosynthesis
MTKKALVLLAEGFEEVEAVTPLDYLRRAGITVNTAAVNGPAGAVKGSHGIPIIADTDIEHIKGGEWDALLLPGGMPGAPNIAASAQAGALIREMTQAEKLICAICASPALILAPLGLLAGRRFTCFPGLEAQVTDGHWVEEPVVIDGTLITSRAAGTAAAWAMAIIGQLLDGAASEKIARQVLLAG